jgi:hypothetical protein
MLGLVRNSVLALAIFALPANAEVGIEFSKMPVGCSWITSYSNGNQWRETFKGKKKGSYTTETVELRNPSKIISRTRFNSEGLMVYKEWVGQGWDKFNPYSCFGVSGNCKFQYTNADGMSVTIENKTTRKGKKYIVRSGIVGGEKYPDEMFELGPFNIMVSNKASNYSARSTGFENCGLSS